LNTFLASPVNGSTSFILNKVEGLTPTSSRFIVHSPTLAVGVLHQRKELTSCQAVSQKDHQPTEVVFTLFSIGYLLVCGLIQDKDNKSSPPKKWAIFIMQMRMHSYESFGVCNFLEADLSLEVYTNEFVHSF
jgi:hypothetical protein